MSFPCMQFYRWWIKWMSSFLSVIAIGKIADPKDLIALILIVRTYSFVYIFLVPFIMLTYYYFLLFFITITYHEIDVTVTAFLYNCNVINRHMVSFIPLEFNFKPHIYKCLGDKSIWDEELLHIKSIKNYILIWKWLGFMTCVLNALLNVSNFVKLHLVVNFQL